LAGALTPKAAIWNVMQITKIHFSPPQLWVVAKPTDQGGGKRRLSRMSIADEMREEHRLGVLGE
jgi:hypothetical protein